MNATETIGTTVSLWRYPVKSMLGEELNSAALSHRGLLGDRAYALVDRETGKVASAKEPRKWAALFDCRARFVDEPGEGGVLPVEITLPDGSQVTSDESRADEALSELFGRPVELQQSPPEAPVLEEYWPDIEGLDHRDTVTDEAIPEGTFFDLAPVHVLSTATLDTLRELYPQGQFEVRRFRPNLVVQTAEGASGFVENDWIDKAIAIGSDVELRITGPCPRCVMTTLPQGDLPKDSGILRAAAQHNGVNVGVYASVVRPGAVTRGAPVTSR